MGETRTEPYREVRIDHMGMEEFYSDFIGVVTGGERTYWDDGSGSSDMPEYGALVFASDSFAEELAEYIADWFRKRNSGG